MEDTALIIAFAVYALACLIVATILATLHIRNFIDEKNQNAAACKPPTAEEIRQKEESDKMWRNIFYSRLKLARHDEEIQQKREAREKIKNRKRSRRRAPCKSFSNR